MCKHPSFYSHNKWSFLEKQTNKNGMAHDFLFDKLSSFLGIVPNKERTAEIWRENDLK